VPNIGHFRTILGPQKGVSALHHALLVLSVTVGLKPANLLQPYWYEAVRSGVNDAAIITISAWVGHVLVRDGTGHEER